MPKWSHPPPILELLIDEVSDCVLATVVVVVVVVVVYMVVVE